MYDSRLFFNYEVQLAMRPINFPRLHLEHISSLINHNWFVWSSDLVHCSGGEINDGPIGLDQGEIDGICFQLQDLPTHWCNNLHNLPPTPTNMELELLAHKVNIGSYVEQFNQ